MRTIKGLTVPQDTNTTKFPQGQILNETSTVLGTPVIREIYGDILTNIYAILASAGITPNQMEDAEDTSYQLLQALKVFHNELNDLEQVLTVSGTNLNTTFDFDNLPNNYVFIGKVSDALAASTNYNLVSTGTKSVGVSNTSAIAASSVVLVTIKDTTATVLNLSAIAAVATTTLTTAFGTPLSFNETTNMLYFSNGTVFDESPKSYLVENAIQVAEGSLDINILDTIVHKGKLICFTLNTSTLTYQAFSFDLSNLDVLEGEITMPKVSGVDNQPYMYSDGVNVYFTNSTNTINDSTNDYAVGCFLFDATNLTLTSVSFSNIDTNFEKTTNVFVNTDGNLFTFIAGNVYRYNLGGAARVFLDNFNTLNGFVFKFAGQNYYTNGEVAVSWNY